jgi:hypothetical protein
MREFSPQVWFGERELKHVPPHFVKCHTSINSERMQWVHKTLTGRYALSSYYDHETFFLDVESIIYFENPAEATLYELRWS